MNLFSHAAATTAAQATRSSTSPGPGSEASAAARASATPSVSSSNSRAHMKAGRSAAAQTAPSTSARPTAHPTPTPHPASRSRRSRRRRSRRSRVPRRPIQPRAARNLEDDVLSRPGPGQPGTRAQPPWLHELPRPRLSSEAGVRCVGDHACAPRRSVDRGPHDQRVRHFLVARYSHVWFREAGVPAAPGTTLVTVSGATERPGVYEIELGTPIGEVIRLAGGPAERPRPS